MVLSLCDLYDLNTGSQTTVGDIPGFYKGGGACGGEKGLNWGLPRHVCLGNGFPSMKKRGAQGRDGGQLLSLEQGSSPQAMLQKWYLRTSIKTSVTAGLGLNDNKVLDAA